ncbi:hypothetical protein D3C74_320850 [compost metagenome]
MYHFLLTDDRRNRLQRRVGEVTFYVANEHRLHRIEYRQQRDVDLKGALLFRIEQGELLRVLGHRDLIRDPVVEQQHFVQLVHMRHADVIPVQDARAFAADDPR